ncbi:TRAP transporter substrate-binding protein [Deltaproteobacteria bacterium OttesenSCG-928-M10]|nr:TRAP transporter substrate-binding protein [Deltaproteobacteria bacterium OttesenSCG-928-M10]
MIRTFALALALTLILTVSGVPAQAAPIVFKIATVESDETSTTKALLEFEKFVEEKTGGQVDVQYFANGVLGGEREIVEGVALGTIQLAFPAASVLSMYDDKFNLFELPFIYNSFDVAYAVWDGEIGDTYTKWMEDQGFTNLGCVAYSARGFSNNVRPVRTPADMKGLKIRVIESQLYIELFKAFGANPTPMSETEIYTGLQQGTIQGLDQGPMQVYMMKYYEQIKYYTWLKHVIMPVPFIANKAYIEGLPEDIRAVILEGLTIAKDKLRKQLYEDEITSLEDLRKAGIEVIPELTPEETAQFRTLLEPIYANYRKIVGDEMFDKMLSYNDK